MRVDKNIQTGDEPTNKPTENKQGGEKSFDFEKVKNLAKQTKTESLVNFVNNNSNNPEKKNLVQVAKDELATRGVQQRTELSERAQEVLDLANVSAASGIANYASKVSDDKSLNKKERQVVIKKLNEQIKELITPNDNKQEQDAKNVKQQEQEITKAGITELYKSIEYLILGT